MSFTNKVVLITGGASCIGFTIALSFAKLNARLCITDKNETDLLKVKEECEGLTKAAVLEVVADVCNDIDVAKILDRALKKFGKLDVLVNCAGIVRATSLQDTDLVEKFDEIMSVNLRAVIAVTRQALPALIESRGCIINMSSVGSKLISRNTIAYNISKAGVTSFTKLAAFELSVHGVRVNCISPGPVKTNLWVHAGTSNEENETIWDNVGKLTALKRCVKFEEVAELAVYLASEKATSITGSDFVIDSGILLGTIDSGPNIPDKTVKNLD